MKKICFMSGAMVNAGDFLIEKRALELIKHFIPDSETTIFKRVGVDYSNRIDELNRFDAIFFAGGPLYQPGLYNHSLPFVNPLLINKIKVPIFFLGGGLHRDFYYCKFSETDRILFNKGLHETVPIGCRDIFTLKFLKHEGYKALLTGCPAWYDLNFVEQMELKTSHPLDIHKICVSEPAKNINVPLFMDLLLHMRKKYPDAEIIIVNHRELKTDIVTKQSELKDKYNIGFINIAGSVDGFKIYDDCDLHVGFRVHAHIYNLSKRNFTVLFNEDIRGMGVNQTLGLGNINVDNPTPKFRKKRIFGRYYLIHYNKSQYTYHNVAGWMFDDYLNDTIEQNFVNYKNAFQNMTIYFQNMTVFFESANDLICNK